MLRVAYTIRPNVLETGKDAMESLQFRFQHGKRLLLHSAQCVGVVSSGNLEILIEPFHLNGDCEISISTAARGFAPIWEAVMHDFHARWNLRDTRIAINDMGATPAVVSLRLDQAVESMLQAAP